MICLTCAGRLFGQVDRCGHGQVRRFRGLFFGQGNGHEVLLLKMHVWHANFASYEAFGLHRIIRKLWSIINPKLHRPSGQAARKMPHGPNHFVDHEIDLIDGIEPAQAETQAAVGQVVG